MPSNQNAGGWHKKDNIKRLESWHFCRLQFCCWDTMLKTTAGSFSVVHNNWVFRPLEIKMTWTASEFTAVVRKWGKVVSMCHYLVDVVIPKAWCAIHVWGCFLSPNSRMLTFIFTSVFISWFNLKTAKQEGLLDPFLYTYCYTKQNSNGSSGLQHIEVAQFSYQFLPPRSDLSSTQEKDWFLHFLKACTKILGRVILSKKIVDSFTIQDCSFLSSNKKKNPFIVPVESSCQDCLVSECAAMVCFTDLECTSSWAPAWEFVLINSGWVKLAVLCKGLTVWPFPLFNLRRKGINNTKLKNIWIQELQGLNLFPRLLCPASLWLSK